MVLEGHDNMNTATATKRERKSVFDRWSEKLKDFLDNAE
jgi:cell division protein FtsA